MFCFKCIEIKIKQNDFYYFNTKYTITLKLRCLIFLQLSPLLQDTSY